MRDVWTEYRTFFREFRQRYHTTGSITPSSRFLARAIASELRRKSRPVRVLEAGPGTGALTREIVRYIGPHDRFDLVELSDSFVSTLYERFNRDPPFRRIRDRVRIFHGPVQAVQASEPYDYIISGLPLNNFSTPLVREIFASFQRLLADDGVLSYFEYLWLRDLRLPFLNRSERFRLLRIGYLFDAVLDRFEFRRDEVYVNFPPAVVHHLRFGDGRGVNVRPA